MGTPWAVRSANKLLAYCYHPNKLVSKQLDYARLLEKACQQTGLSDLGDSQYTTLLKSALAAVQQEGQLSWLGVTAIKSFTYASLLNRLRIVERLKQQPDILAVELPPPLIITGWYRSGTTFLHNLLSQLPSLQSPLLWQLRHPYAVTERQAIKRKVNRELRIHRYLSPGFLNAHPMAADKPDECLFLFENAGVAVTTFFISEMQRFAWQLLETDLQPAYHFYKDQLKLLSWQGHNATWLLKWPYHLWQLSSLFNVMPAAKVIHIHRDPVQAIPSVCSLAMHAREPFCQSIDCQALGRFWLDYYAAGAANVVLANEQYAQNIIHVQYTDLLKQPAKLVQDIAEQLQLDYTAAEQRQLESFIADNQRSRGKVKKHQYNLAQFGLTQQAVEQKLGGYMERFII